MPIRIEPAADGVHINVKVVPGASRDRIVGALGDALKVAVSKPPQGGAANDAVVRLLAEALSVHRNQVQLVRGHSNPRKELLIRGISAADVRSRLGLA